MRMSNLKYFIKLANFVSIFGRINVHRSPLLKPSIEEILGRKLYDFAKQHWVIINISILMSGLILGMTIGKSLNAFGLNLINAFETILLFIVLPLVTLVVGLIFIIFKKLSWSNHMVPLFGLGYGLGAFISILVMYMGNFVTVSLSTTFPELINVQTVNLFLVLTSWPLELCGLEFNTHQMAQSLFSVNDNLMKDTALEWRNYLLSAIVGYSVAPRFILALPIRISYSEKQHETKKNAYEFQIDTNIDSFEDYFRIDSEELRLLSSIQKQLVLNDINQEFDLDKKIMKKSWLDKWEEGILQISKKKLVADAGIIEDEISRLVKSGYKKLNVTLFEAIIFNPYFQLDKDFSSKNLKCKEKIVVETIKRFSKKALVDFLTIEKAKSSFLNRQKKYSSYWSLDKLAIIATASFLMGAIGWAAAPFIGASIGGSLGLSGVVAELAGLAMLGGGAVALGGWGVAGGTAIVIGGGAVLGLGGGSIYSIYMMPGGSAMVAQDIAKVETLIYEVLLDEVTKPKEYLISRLNDLVLELENAIAVISEDQKVGVLKEQMSEKEMHRSIKIVKERINYLKN